MGLGSAKAVQQYERMLLTTPVRRTVLLEEKRDAELRVEQASQAAALLRRRRQWEQQRMALP